MRFGTAAIAAAAALFAPLAAPAQDDPPARVEAGRRVAIEYTLTLDDGTLADSNVGGDPLVYRHGAGDLLPGLERALDGMAVGESKQGALEAAEAYGAIDATLFQDVDAERIPEADRRIGAKLEMRDATGARQLVRVHEVRGERIVIDLNHPYAGSDVRYVVKVLRVE